MTIASLDHLENHLKTLVIGASGLVGRYLLKEFSAIGEALGTFNKQKQDDLVQLDLAQPDAITRLSKDFRPDTILLPGALTNVDFCEENEALSQKVNLDGTCWVANCAEQLGARLVYFSTDYVFDGTAGPYAESDALNPINVYSRHKAAAE